MKGNLTKQYISVLAIIYLLLLFLRYRDIPYYNRSINTFIVVCETSLLWITVVGVVHAVLINNLITKFDIL